MPSPKFDQYYPDAEAERGKFVPLDMTDTTSYPVSGRGKFAVLTYNVGSGASSSAPAYTITQVSSSIPNQISSYRMTINNTVSSVTVTVPVTFLEVYNNVASGSSTAYIVLSTTAYNHTTAIGIPITTNTLYSIDNVLVSTFTIATNGNSDLRIFGHYKQ